MTTANEIGKIINIDSIPSMPHIVTKVMALIADPDSTAAQVGKLISQDQAMTAKILQVANSPFYGRVRAVTTVKDAIILMGFPSIKGLVISSGARFMVKNPGLLENLLWDHSTGAAFAAYEVAKAVMVIAPDEAFTAGLLHDITRVIIAVVNREQFTKIMQQSYNRSLKPEEVLILEKKQLGYTHTEVAPLVCEKWHLGDNLLAALAGHHIDREGRNFNPSSPRAAIAMVTCMANLILYEMGIGNKAPVEGVNAHDHFCAKQLGLDKNKIMMICEKIQAAYEEQKNSFSLS